MTPSGFNIGMTLKTKRSLSILASSLSVSVKKFKTPRIIQDPTVSPGWTLADITIAFFFYVLLNVDISNFESVSSQSMDGFEKFRYGTGLR